MKCEYEVKKNNYLEDKVQIEFLNEEIFLAIPLVIDGKIKYEGCKINVLIPTNRIE